MAKTIITTLLNFHKKKIISHDKKLKVCFSNANDSLRRDVYQDNTSLKTVIFCKDILVDGKSLPVSRIRIHDNTSGCS